MFPLTKFGLRVKQQWSSSIIVILHLLLLYIPRNSGQSGSSHMCADFLFKAQKSTLILTEDSTANGAVKLKAIHTHSAKACERSCCILPECTVAVFETTTRNICYLFNCGTDGELCEFQTHSKYTTSFKTKLSITQPEKVGYGKQNWKPHLEVTSTVAPEQINYNDLILATAFKLLRRVAKATGDQQKRSDQCRYPPEVQFRCLDSTKLPVCIAIYDRCDGVPQCGDSSDELNCPQPLSAASDNSNGKRNRQHKSGVATESPAGTSAGDTSAAADTTVTEIDGPSQLYTRYLRTRTVVVCLGAALAVTMVAVIALGCRLRQLRARIGGVGKYRGSRSVEDEDYLINGMYL